MRPFVVIYIIVYFSFVIIDITAISSVNSSDRVTFNHFYAPSLETILYSIGIHFVYLFFLVATILTFRKTSFFYIDKGVDYFSKRRTNILILVFTLFIFFTAVSFLYKVGSSDIIDYIFRVRSGEQSIGGLMYIVMLGFPIVLIHEQRKNVRIMLLFLMILVNLLSGFRLILIWSIILLGFDAYVRKSIRVNFRNIGVLSFGIFLILVIGVFRETILSAGENFRASDYILIALSSTNRTYPVSYLAYIIDKGVHFPVSGLLNIILTPALALFDFFIKINYSPFDTFEIKVFAEKMFREFLFFRGTPDFEPTGFSLNFIPFFYSFGGIIGVSLIGIVYGFFFLFSFKLIKSISFYRQLMGLLIMTFLFGCFETFSVSWGLFFYSTLLVLILWVFSLVLQPHN